MTQYISIMGGNLSLIRQEQSSVKYLTLGKIHLFIFYLTHRYINKIEI
jgi:hypothetical protein